MGRAIGLDIGADSIKVVELTGSAKAPKVQRLAIREIPAPPAVQNEDDAPFDQDAATAQVIKEIFDGLKLPKDDVCASFDSGVTVFREITVPFFEEDQIKKVIRFEAENHLHNHGIEDVVVNWIKTGETRDGSRVMVFASPKVDLARHMAILRQAGVRPASVDLDTTSLFTTLDAVGYVEDHPDAIVLDVGSHTTNLILLSEGKPRVMRSFLLGAGAVEQAVTEALGVPRTEGRQRVLQAIGESTAGDLFVPAADVAEAESETEKSLTQIQGDVVSERRSGFVQKLHREVARSLLSVRADTPPASVLLLGGGSLLPGLAEQLEESLGLPVERVNLLDRVECKDPGENAEYTGVAVGSAVGCGLRLMGRNPLSVELLQDEFSPTNTLDVIKTPLCLAVTLLFLAVLGFTFSERERKKAVKFEFNNWAWNAQKMFLKVEPEYLHRIEKKNLQQSGNKLKGEAVALARRRLDGWTDNPRMVINIKNHLLRRHKALQAMLGLAKDIPELPSALETIVAVYESLGTVDRNRLGDWFQIESMEINERSFRMKVIASKQDVENEVRSALNSNAYLQSRAERSRDFTVPGTSTRLQSGRMRMEFSIDFKDES